MSLEIDQNGASISAQLRILNAHIGTYRIDLWNDSDGSGGPSAGDQFDRTLKEYKQSDSGPVLLGSPALLLRKTLQFLWLARQNPGSSAPSRVELSLWQGSQMLSGFPQTVEVAFPNGQHYGAFQIAYFVKAQGS